MNGIKPDYLYSFICHEEERGLCELEARRLLDLPASFKMKAGLCVAGSMREIDVDRSPFMKHRMQIWHEAASRDELEQYALHIDLKDASFKITVWDAASNETEAHSSTENKQPTSKAEKQELAKQIGQRIKGTVDLKSPRLEIGIAYWLGKWYIGAMQANTVVWQQHHSKPRQYSTALSTRMARAIVNIAVPSPAGIQAIDPCCGIGTVLLEAASMGIAVSGREINPLAAQGARENLAYFHYDVQVVLGDMRDIKEKFDVAIIDMPYNLCSVLPMDDKLSMLRHARQFAEQLVIVTVEPLDQELLAAGFQITDRCAVSKGKFRREILCCS